jgi:hypothetical protein
MDVLMAALLLPVIVSPLLRQPPVLHYEDDQRKHGNERHPGDLSVQDGGVWLGKAYLAMDRDQYQLDTPRYGHGQQQQLGSQDNYAKSQSSAKKHSATPTATLALAGGHALLRFQGLHHPGGFGTVSRTMPLVNMTAAPTMALTLNSHHIKPDCCCPEAAALPLAGSA